MLRECLSQNLKAWAIYCFFGFDFAGVYTKLVPHELIEYSFGGRAATLAFLNQAHGVLVRVSFDAEDTHTESCSATVGRLFWIIFLNTFQKNTPVEAKLLTY